MAKEKCKKKRLPGCSYGANPLDKTVHLYFWIYQELGGILNSIGSLLCQNLP